MTGLTAAATPAAPALVMRPWQPSDVPALIETFRDAELRHRISYAVEDEAGGRRWVETQEEGWAAGDRFAFAVLETPPGDRSRAGDEPQPAPTGARLVGNVVLKNVAHGKPSAEVGYWTAGHARGRGVAPRALRAVTDWAFGAFAARGLECLELLHQVDNEASCRVAEKCGYAFARVLPAYPPDYPLDGHLHIRHRDGL